MVLYYSNYCCSCRTILPILSQSQVQNDIHFICIDNRIKKPNGEVNIILSNQKEILLPETVTQVPALLLLNRGSQVLFGNDILKYLQPVKSTSSLENNIVEPECFDFQDTTRYGVSSDMYSYLDQSSESLSTKGDGGLRQIRNNARLDHIDVIETPPENYIPNKLSNTSMEQIENERNSLMRQ